MPIVLNGPNSAAERPVTVFVRTIALRKASTYGLQIRETVFEAIKLHQPSRNKKYLAPGRNFAIEMNAGK